jgi:hypothetical protein
MIDARKIISTADTDESLPVFAVDAAKHTALRHETGFDRASGSLEQATNIDCLNPAHAGIVTVARQSWEPRNRAL